MKQTLKQLQDGELQGVTSLKLVEELEYFPEEIFTLADTLEILDLSRNKLSALPLDFGRLKKLRIFFCSENLFTTLPEVLADCPLLDIVGFKANNIATVPAKAINHNLRWLILTNNQIEQIPASIGRCSRMQKLMLAGNRLKTLPQELSNCKNLALLRISANQLTELPEWLLTMPKLAWLAYSGNPFSKKVNVTPLPGINWSELQLERVLGEGASGVIYKAHQWFEGVKKELAVKVFKGAVTSDGLPEDEMNACIAAGAHPGLVTLTGQIEEHPENKKGLVMELIPPHFYNLGITPSFESCSRDVFKEDQELTAQQVLNIAGTIASVARQLHSKGIMHSDLYAHNTLIDDEGNTLFGDFGAACFYDQTNNAVADALQRLEVLAYGYLLDDLLSICPEAQANENLIKFEAVKTACLNADVLSRPSFAYLDEALIKLQA